ncbi:MAG: hypothetical protein M2R45_05302 [Verrucomicrobia subdivision 3 bacterium]|nr:hypothetical protein [Limisphaerales bacterium]MCS1417819.1 hypothetical protein [Limisphaerales bacterium]
MLPRFWKTAEVASGLNYTKAISLEISYGNWLAE